MDLKLQIWVQEIVGLSQGLGNGCIYMNLIDSYK
jgi:hypothetical protein